MKGVSLSPTLTGVLLTLVFFSVLVIAPKAFVKRSFTLQEPISEESPIRFPLDREFTIVKRGHHSKSKKETVSLNDLLVSAPNGLLVNFWASWCEPCLEELPSLDQLNRQLVQVTSGAPQLVTISVDERQEDISRLYKTLDFSPTFLVLLDRDGEVARLVGTVKFPETYLLGREGKIIHKWIGPQNWLSQEVISKISSF